MSNGENGRTWPELRTGTLIISSALVAAGTLIALAGVAVGSTHVLSATRRWVGEMETSPSDLARLKWQQARAAAAAGAVAWQNGSAADPASIS